MLNPHKSKLQRNFKIRFALYSAMAFLAFVGLAETLQENSVASSSPAQSRTGSITAYPNPISVTDGSGLGITHLSWNSTGTTQVQVRIGSPSGAVFRTSAPNGSGTTGKWVHHGMIVYLQDVSGGLPLTPENTLATVTVNLTDQQWNTNGNDISNANSGNVGIGTTNPLYSFDVNGGINGFRSKTTSVSANDTIATFENPDGIQVIMRGNGNLGLGTISPVVRLAINGPGVNVYNTDAWIENNIHVQGNEMLLQGGRGRLRLGSAWGYAGLYSDASSVGVGNDLVLGSSSGNVRVGPGAGAAQNFLVPNGNVGIGTASPTSARLHLYSPSHTYLRIGAPLANQSAIAFNDDTNGQDIVLYRPENTRNFSIWTATASNVLTVTQPGNVGVGTTTPGFKLDVQGQINSSSGLCIAGDCKTAWSQVGGNSQWTTSGTTINYSAGNVGIGIDTPTEKLHVTGNVKVSGSIDVGGNINAKYQDVAEWVESSQELNAGTVVVLDSSRSNQVIAATQSYDSRVAGVISLRPGLTLGDEAEGRVLVATTGRVKVKVDATERPIQIGDLLVTSNREGFAMKSLPVEIGGVRLHRPGTLVGKALEPLAKGTGEILVLLSLQ